MGPTTSSASTEYKFFITTHSVFTTININNDFIFDIAKAMPNFYLHKIKRLADSHPS